MRAEPVTAAFEEEADAEENLRGIHEFMRAHGLASVALVPCNRSAGAKYEGLDRAYEIDAERQTQGQLESFLCLACEAGLEPEIG